MAIKSLVIVESPAKARTIASYLGKDFVVESSIGHIRDLPKRAADIPAQYKKEPWSRLGVNVDDGFKPLYVVDADKKQHINHLKALLKDADQLFLATDEDREGESIAWHLLEVLKPKVPVKRMVFHEITKTAIQKAISAPRELDRRLVEAQETRRILDRLFGYEVSPVLWKKVMPRLSAGRVQSVATRIVVQREHERIRFRNASYYSVETELEDAEKSAFSANVVSIDGKKIASGRDFDDSGKLKDPNILALNLEQAEQAVRDMSAQEYRVEKVEKKASKRSPAPPFMTSTLQQEAGRKLRFSSSRTMRAAQGLYEQGFITYMRTDSTTLSQSAVVAARELIKEIYGADYLPAAPRVFQNKVKNAQEAHEAIRPAGDSFQHPSKVALAVGPDEAKLYELIWKRTVACQMADAKLDTVRVDVSSVDQRFALVATGTSIAFPGFLRAYVEGSDDPDADLEQRERHLPQLKDGQSVKLAEVQSKHHETQPPARYTEASLVRKLEELGVGRPSTYASIISTIQGRGYVYKRGSALVPSFTAFAVTSLLEQHFPGLVDYAFTARMEDELDLIAGGSEHSAPWLSRFYFGDAEKKGTFEIGLRQLVSDKLGDIDAREVNSLPLGKDAEDREVIIRVGRFGPYVQRGEDTASVPEDLAPDELTLEKAGELLAQPSGDREVGIDPESGLQVFVRSGRFGSYVQLGEAGGKDKPKTGSLLTTDEPQNVDLAHALKLLSLPREVGTTEEGETIFAALGRFGPYLSKGKDSRSLENEDQVFTVTLAEALVVYAQPKTRGKRAAAEPLKTLGKDTTTDAIITVKEGRFGLYVTDGETNASLRKGDTLEAIDTDRANELLAARRAAGPVKKKTVKKAAKKASKKVGEKKESTSKKSATKKATSKKTTAKDAASEEAATKKVTSKKVASKKSVTKKATSKKTSTKKVASKKAASKKA